MRFFTFILLFITLIGAIAYLTFLNQGYMIVYLSRTHSYEIPIVALILFSMAFGGLLVGAGAGVQRLKNMVSRWRKSSRQKRDARAREAYTTALNTLLAGREIEASELFERLLEMEPNHVQGLWRLGNIRRAEKQFSEAIQLHRKAFSLDEHHMEIFLDLVRDLEEAQRFQDAIQLLADLTGKDDRNRRALLWLRDLNIRLNCWEAAHQVQEKILKRTTGSGEHRQEEIILLGLKYELGRHFLNEGLKDQARKQFKGAVRMDGNFLPGHIGLGEISIQDGRLDKAAEIWAKAYQATANVILLHRLEDLFLEIGEPDRILQIYLDAVEKNPADQILKFYLGKLYYRLEMLDNAFEMLNAIDPGEERFADLHTLLGELYLRQGDLDTAVKEFKTATDLGRPVLLPYACAVCHWKTVRWVARCQHCRQWDTLQVSPLVLSKLPEKQPFQVSS